MKKKKRGLALWLLLAILVLSLVLSVSGCGHGEEASGKSIRIGITLYDQYDTFISGLMDSFQKDVADLRAEGEDISIEVYNAAGNQATQNEQVTEMINKGCDVICVNLVDRTAPTEIIDMARKNNVPVIFFNRELVAEDPLQWNRLYYVGADAFKSGIMQGELAVQRIQEGEGSSTPDPETSSETLTGTGETEETAAEADLTTGEAAETTAAGAGLTTGESTEASSEAGASSEEAADAAVEAESSQESVQENQISDVDKNADGKIQYIVLEGEPGHQDAIVRSEYAVNTLIENGISVEKLGYAIANWNRAEAKTKMTQLLSEYGEKIELVLANNDDMALGAIDACKALRLNREDWPLIYGIDGTAVGLEAVLSQEMAGTVYNDKEGQADAMLRLAMKLIRGESLEELQLIDGKYIRLPYEKVTLDNAAAYQSRAEERNS